jgi:hypothetical protein
MSTCAVISDNLYKDAEIGYMTRGPPSKVIGSCVAPVIGQSGSVCLGDFTAQYMWTSDEKKSRAANASFANLFADGPGPALPKANTKSMDYINARYPIPKSNGPLGSVTCPSYGTGSTCQNCSLSVYSKPTTNSMAS